MIPVDKGVCGYCGKSANLYRTPYKYHSLKELDNLFCSYCYRHVAKPIMRSNPKSKRQLNELKQNLKILTNKIKIIETEFVELKSTLNYVNKIIHNE